MRRSALASGDANRAHGGEIRASQEKMGRGRARVLAASNYRKGFTLAFPAGGGGEEREHS